MNAALRQRCDADRNLLCRNGSHEKLDHDAPGFLSFLSKKKFLWSTGKRSELVSFCIVLLLPVTPARNCSDNCKDIVFLSEVVTEWSFWKCSRKFPLIFLSKFPPYLSISRVIIDRNDSMVCLLDSIITAACFWFDGDGAPRSTDSLYPEKILQSAVPSTLTTK